MENNNIEHSALQEPQRLIELTKRLYTMMFEKDILISIYTNASGFLWNAMMVDSGTDLGWSEFNGDCEMSGSFTSYENALEDGLNLVDKCDMKRFKKECPKGRFHWGNWANFARGLNDLKN